METLGRSGMGLLLLLVCSCPGLLAQSDTNSTRGLVPPKRYLFIIETSHSMQRRADGTLLAIQKLLSGGIGGQLRRGDTIGIWTFDSELHAGNFPLQQWSPDTHRPVCLRVANFVKDLKYQGQAKLEKALPAMDKLVKDSDLITVILVADGNQEIQGTPFDDRINENFKMWKSEQQSARMPLITVLRAVGGKMTQFTVNPAQWQVDVPPLPPEYQKIQIAKTVTNAPPKAPPVVGQSLILTGKKPSVSDASRNPPKESTPRTVVPSPDADLNPKPPTPQPNATGTQLTPPVVAKAEPQELANPQPGATPATSPAAIAPAVIPPTLAQPPVAQKLDEAKSTTASPPAAQTKPTTENVSQPQEVVSNPTATSADRPGQSPVVGDGITPKPRPGQGARAAEAVVPGPSGSLFPVILLWIAIGIVVMLTIGGIVVLRRSRPISQASLITRSIDRQEKK